MLDVNDFDQIRIGLATADGIRMWSNGEVKKPETINYRTLKPEKDGLFCEKIFGPTKDWECYCGKYKRVRFKGIICERCGVEVTRSKVRRERMGHIELAAPAVHIWYLRGTRSWLAYLLMGTEPREELKAKQLEKVIYFAANMVVWVDEDKRHDDLTTLEAELVEERLAIEEERDAELNRRQEALEAELTEMEGEGAKDADLRSRQKSAEKDLSFVRDQYEEEIDVLNRAWDEFTGLFSRQIIEDEPLWRELVDRWGDYFEGGMGADALAQLIDRIDFDEEEVKLRAMIDPPEGQKPLSAQRKQKAIKRLKIVAALNRRDKHGRRVNEPRAMILDAVPVIPPELRPMVQLDGGRFATSDLNDLYRRVINRNNRLKRLLDLGAPGIIINNEKRMLQEAVDALFDNGRRGRPVTGPGNRPLKSLSDMLKGKQGRFRQNLLGKRVDYSGRSVIVAGPTLKFHQCGLPKIMALELFKPFVMKKLVDDELAPNIKSAKRMVERRKPQVWTVLGSVIEEHPVLLNRAPTLHRLGIQAFEPVLVEGKAIQIHPLVCTAFNADFDGDQMAVHLPLSAEAQAEARVLMLSANNVLSPAHGRPLVTPTQDMIIGGYYLTMETESSVGEGRVFRHVHELEHAMDEGGLELHSTIQYRSEDYPGLKATEANGSAATWHTTTPGRVLFNEVLPVGFTYVNHRVDKKGMTDLVDDLARHFTKKEVAESLDGLKDLCFKYATRSGLTVSIDDVKTPPEKQAILDSHEKDAAKVEGQFRKGIITDGERRQKEVEIWNAATQEVTEKMVVALQADEFNPIDVMVDSGARGNMMQVRQIAGMRGLVANPRGDLIPRPIKSNFKEGLTMLEYFIATPGARKGLVDTALRTADSGYLTRRLVDVSQELIINEYNPFEGGGAAFGIWIDDVEPDQADKRTYLDTRLLSRTLADDVTLADGTVYEAGTIVGEDEMNILRDDTMVNRVRVLSPLTDDSTIGVSAACYGMSLATSKPIEVGEAVGVIAAQSIGEPGTQLTMRTFHTGGVAGKDLAGGLPRVVELFEARTPKGKATLARISGVIRIGEDEGRGREITVVADDGEEETYLIPGMPRLEVVDGQEVKAGDPIVEGPRDPKELLEIKGVRETQQYLVEEVQKVYRDQGVSIHDKHIELIVRQMTRRVKINDPGESEFLPGEQVDQRQFAETNRNLVDEGKRPAEGRPELMGITKASLATESWLSAASFQETTRVLTEAAIESKSDRLIGLKENIIIGKLVPAGTGMEQHRSVAPHAPDYKPMDFYSSADEEQDLAAWLAGQTDADEDPTAGAYEADVIDLAADATATDPTA
ncbi:MAG: DNA-directed RNA polymerase subunit beta' [Actinobacteria bacterium]|nr:DNA-directed RNA polymerase subunit beta' [Actinomycetota bacterium]MBT3745757.1 DNA-directed RNA polymerase subunit beta' [Actinomycetota bacterium]MBT3969052.1 DNA-directed RNA polymerase subunit beta' [Actinomycetota bacterium]MBT4010553.1 DNA-directed RNA polymerase subunit beta' [Actinomycetota bacterium]MBT4302205.1 DNA-directed RNA polymerase subunit beta' [Actinomycetota bacterium]